jgi:hypothetical protein
MVNINKIIDEYLLEQTIPWSGLDLQGIIDLLDDPDTGDGSDGGGGDQNVDWRITMGREMDKHRLETGGDNNTPELPDFGGYGVDTGTYIQNNLDLKLPPQITKPDGTLVPRYTGGDPNEIRTCPTCDAPLPHDVDDVLSRAQQPKPGDVVIE